MRSEKTFQGEMRQALRTLPKVKFYHKIPDLGALNPFDAFLIYDGIAIAMEYKISKNTVSIPIHQLFSNRDHEITALRRFKESGGRAYVLINIFDAHKTNFVYVVDIDQYVALMNDILPSKSIKLTDERLKRWCIMEKVKNNYDMLWDLNKVIGATTS